MQWADGGMIQIQLQAQAPRHQQDQMTKVYEGTTKYQIMHL